MTGKFIGFLDTKTVPLENWVKSYLEILENQNIDIVFVLQDVFGEETAPEGKKYALVRPTVVGIDSETHYAVQSGIEEDEIIVSGSFRVLS